MNLYEVGQDDQETSETVSMTYEEYLEYKETLEAQVEIADAARKLATLPEFDLVVMQGYFTKEPERLAALMASGKINQKSFEACTDNLRAIADFRKFLTEQLERGNVARNQLQSLEESYQEAVASGAMSTSSMN